MLRIFWKFDEQFKIVERGRYAFLESSVQEAKLGESNEIISPKLTEDLRKDEQGQ